MILSTTSGHTYIDADTLFACAPSGLLARMVDRMDACHQDCALVGLIVRTTHLGREEVWVEASCGERTRLVA